MHIDSGRDIDRKMRNNLIFENRQQNDAVQSSPFFSVIDFWPQVPHDFEGFIHRIEDGKIAQSAAPSSSFSVWPVQNCKM